MINKLMKYLFGEKEVVREEDPSIQKAAEDEKDLLHNVGEPVISFVKNFDEKNFTFESWICMVYKTKTTKVTDSANGEVFFYTRRSTSWGNEVTISTPSFLTKEEEKYIIEKLIEPLERKAGKRRSRVNEKRRKLKEERERRRLKKLYCEEDNR